MGAILRPIIIGLRCNPDQPSRIEKYRFLGYSMCGEENKQNREFIYPHQKIGKEWEEKRRLMERKYISAHMMTVE